MFTTVSIQGNKNSVFKNFLKTQVFTETGDTQSLHFWSNFGPFFPSEEDGQIKKTFLEEKIHLLDYPKIIKSRRSPLQMKNRINFCNFLAFFGKNLTEVKS